MKHLIFFALFLFNLHGGKGQSKPTVLVVLCDISKSVSKHDKDKNISNNEQLEIIKKSIEQVPNKVLMDSEIIFFPVSDKSVKKPLGGEVIKKNRVSEMELLREKRRIEGLILRVNEDLSKLARSPNDNNNSCILTSISNAFRFLESKKIAKGNNYNYHLLIFSDMLEYCDSFTDYKIDMEQDIKNKEDFITKYVNNANLSYVNFDRNNIGVSIISTSPDMKENKFRQIESIWIHIFHKMGYSKDIKIKTTL